MSQSSFAERWGLHNTDRGDAVAGVLEEAKAQNLETVRLSFVDQHGILRGKVIVVEDLSSAINDGLSITSTLLLKDTSHTTVFPVWGGNAGFGDGVMTGASDLIMLPDPSTFRVLPWSPHCGWMLCDLYDCGGKPVPLSTRQVLRQGVSRLLDAGMEMVCGLEVEFAVYRLDSPNLAHHQAGKPGQPPDTTLLSQGYQYLTEQQYDRLEGVMDLLRRHSEALRLPVRTMEAEFGPSQFEMTFQPADPISAADNMALFRSMVKQVCEREGLHATFMCRPGVPNAMGNGWHLHQSLRDSASGHNLFVPEAEAALSPVAAKWIAGLLTHARESCLLTTPTINGYKRYQPFALAPDRVQWGRDNRGAMVRSLCEHGNPASRLENRVGEPAANPYLYVASQLYSGLDGVEHGLQPPSPVEAPYEGDADRLPLDLGEALQYFAASSFWRNTLGDEFVDYYTTLKRAEWRRYMHHVSDWEQREYFSLF